jgi:hypothetical protein
VNAKKLSVGAIASAASLLKSARTKIRRAEPLAVLPLALLGPGSRAENPSPIETQRMSAQQTTDSARAWVHALVKDDRLTSVKKVPLIVEALRKELASPAPTLAVKGSFDPAIQKINYSVSIQLAYIVALVNIVNGEEQGDPTTLQAALCAEKDAEVRDRLALAMGQVSTKVPDPRQAAVYPRIFQLVQSNEESTAKFPYTQAVFALGDAARYPEFRDQAISLLTAVARKGGAGTSREGEHFAMQSGLAAKDVLRKLGYSMVRDAKRQLQAVPKVAAGATTTTK